MIDHNAHQQLIFTKPLPELDVPVSIIIGNYNHSEMVERLVKNLFFGVKRDAPVEIVIGDSGSNKENQDIIKNLLWVYRNHFEMTYVYCDLSKERAEIPKFHGAVRCVNAAARVAKYDYLIYCDSSIVVPPSFIFEMVAPHCGDQHLFVRAPLTNIKLDENEHNTPDRPDYYDYLRSWYKGTRSHGRPAWSMRKDDYFQLGGMDEEMNRYGVADDDLVCRCIMRGIVNSMCETPVIHIAHPEPRDDDERYNAKIMERHIRDYQMVVNQNKTEWGTHTWRLSNE